MPVKSGLDANNEGRMNQVIPEAAISELTDLQGFDLDEIFALTYGHFLPLKGLPPSPGTFWMAESESKRTH